MPIHRSKQDLLGPRQAYPRFSTRSVGASLLIGGVTRQRASRQAPGARTLVVVTVGGDPAVGNAAVAALADAWRARGARRVVRYQFPESLHLNHDVVDPAQIGGNPAVTYPRLIALIDPRPS